MSTSQKLSNKITMDIEQNNDIILQKLRLKLLKKALESYNRSPVSPLLQSD